MEIFKQYKNTNYEVSNLGKLRNSKTGNFLEVRNKLRGAQIFKLNIGGKSVNIIAGKVALEAHNPVIKVLKLQSNVIG